jgi:hypothetical protein
MVARRSRSKPGDSSLCSEQAPQSRIYGARLPRSPAKAGSLAMTMQKHQMRLH